MSDTAKAKAKIASMNRSLKGWLKFRKRNDQIAAGVVAAKFPGALVRDYSGEQELAQDLYTLLSQIHDPQMLPAADVSKDPNAAVALATIAITGELGTEASGPQGQGFIPIIIMTVGAVILFGITSAIRNRAEVQKEKERLECIKAGACTDTGFWLKIGAVGFVGWLLWDKVGLGKRVTGALAKPKAQRRRRR